MRGEGLRCFRAASVLIFNDKDVGQISKTSASLRGHRTFQEKPTRMILAFARTSLRMRKIRRLAELHYDITSFHDGDAAPNIANMAKGQ